MPFEAAGLLFLVMFMLSSMVWLAQKAMFSFLDSIILPFRKSLYHQSCLAVEETVVVDLAASAATAVADARCTQT